MYIHVINVTLGVAILTAKVPNNSCKADLINDVLKCRVSSRLYNTGSKLMVNTDLKTRCLY